MTEASYFLGHIVPDSWDTIIKDLHYLQGCHYYFIITFKKKEEAYPTWLARLPDAATKSNMEIHFTNQFQHR